MSDSSRPKWSHGRGRRIRDVKAKLMERGWVRLWRRSLDSEVFQDPVLWKVWTWCLIRATHNSQVVPIKTGRGYTRVKLDPGQFIFGRNAASAKLRIPPSTVRNKIATLKRLRNLEVKEDNHYSIVSIVNWHTYQSEENKVDRQLDNQRTTKGHIQECKECKEQLLTVPNGTVSDNGGKDAVASTRPPSIPFDQIIEHLNKQTGKAFRPTTKTYQAHIRARWKEGYRLDDFYTVIDTKVDEWLANPKMAGYLRPETLFSTKMASYKAIGKIDAVENLVSWLERNNKDDDHGAEESS